ncbi:MAG: DUF3179 domain-containing protein [Planctomycetes bacterium]|nr:DUF3179 domain-containing protein [Planctomycetota bacterium]
MSVVYGRELDGTVTTFGTTGYTFKRTFALYDRRTQSVWYPSSDTELEAVGGPLLGQRIPFVAKPEVTTLAKWRAKHPNTKILVAEGPLADALLRASVFD